MIAIPMQVSVTDVQLPVGVGASAVGFAAQVATAYAMREGDIYDGEYVFTPSDAVQTVHTAEKTLLQDITINPIPNNYGRITYNGAIITVT